MNGGGAVKYISLLVIFLVAVGCSKKQEDEVKTLYLGGVAKVKGMDPIYSNDRYSGNEVSRVYEGLLEYHYLKRPYVLQENLAESLPQVSEDGLTYTFKLKKGVLFHDNKCFPSGKGREMVASDVVFSVLRNADPKLQGNGWWVLDGKIKGLNEWRELAIKEGFADYNADIDGLKAIDKYTVQFKLQKPFPQFLYSLAMPFYFIVPKEAVEYYGKEFLNHPVGTGPFMLDKFTQSNKIVYKKNPNFRDKFYPSEGTEEDKKAGRLADAGKKLPLVDKIVVEIIKESQPRWLSFMKGKIDYLAIPKDNFDTAITPSKELSPEMIKKKIKLSVTPQLDLTYVAFNHSNELFKDNLNLRKAIALAFDQKKSNELFYNGNGVLAQSIVPPGIAGHIKGYKNPYMQRDVKKAKEYLAKAGYPDGKGLPVITYDTSSSTVFRQMGEFFRKNMAEIGVKIQVTTNPWPELQKKIKTKSTMLHAIAWGADYPDAENFLQLIYGPNGVPGANGSNFDNPEYNELFAKAVVLQDGPERTSLYEKLYKMAAEYVPLVFGVHRLDYRLQQTWLKNFKYTEFDHGQEKYLNVDQALKNETLSKYF